MSLGQAWATRQEPVAQTKEDKNAVPNHDKQTAHEMKLQGTTEWKTWLEM